MRYRYPLSRIIPVRNWANTFASPRLKESYSLRVCLPGSAVSIFLEYLPTPSGSVFLPHSFVLAVFIVVALAWCCCPCGRRPCVMARRATTFAFLPSSNSPCGTHAIRTRLLLCLSVRAVLQICAILIWPDCCLGWLSARVN